MHPGGAPCIKGLRHSAHSYRQTLVLELTSVCMAIHLTGYGLQ